MPRDKKHPLQIQLIDSHLQNVHEHVTVPQLKEYLDSPAQTWVHISSVSEDDLELLSDALGIPGILLQSQLIEEYYPRVEYFEHYAMIFARVEEV